MPRRQVRNLIFGIILQVILLVLIYNNSKTSRYLIISCDDLLKKWNPEVPVLLIDLSFLENLKTEDCRWDETKKVKIGVHVKDKDRSIIDTNRFDVVFYDSPDNKDFLEFHGEPRRIIPKRFETRQIGNFKVPTNIQRFIESYKRSKFVECLGLEMNRKKSKLEDSLELTVFMKGTRRPLIDLFVMYDEMENGSLTHHYVSGLNRDGTKYRYTYPIYDPWCAADLHDHIFWVSCSPMKQVKHEYGPLWYRDHPTDKYKWNKSGKNVKKVGKFSKEEMKKYYLKYKN
ncbi:hypothetical protein GCK72_000305 [Caenorhabditis remanei]|uniref:W02B3.4-like N-terminal domain-containing protein n=1 Tax=Caenorhabditis remanei TaxID=31234 RepID=A0A6A5HQG2_CAERE|nr:hypothetical protein GCK72_000305 [Caenorhabditis remanei]KAF1768493.1 hypothetical protein GCK72_000305 [Caenorhabditis remanei]